MKLRLRRHSGRNDSAAPSTRKLRRYLHGIETPLLPSSPPDRYSGLSSVSRVARIMTSINEVDAVPKSKKPSGEHFSDD